MSALPAFAALALPLVMTRTWRWSWATHWRTAEVPRSPPPWGSWSVSCSGPPRRSWGLAALLATSTEAFTVVKWMGAAYLVYLGLRTLLELRSPDADISPQSQGHDEVRHDLVDRQRPHGRRRNAQLREPGSQLPGRGRVHGPTQPWAAAHIGQCSPEVKAVVVRRSSGVRFAAAQRASSNSGWRVRSPEATRSWSSARTVPSAATSTEPNGSSPASRASVASCRQRRRCRRSRSFMERERHGEVWSRRRARRGGRVARSR